MSGLGRLLAQTFTPPPTRRPDPHRRDRELSKQMAKERGIEIEPLKGGGWNVWPPEGLDSKEADPFHGDHYCGDWSEVYVMVRTYWGRV